MLRSKISEMLTEEGKLIIEVKKRELIYNDKLEDYTDAAKQAEAWNAIGRALVLPAAECKNMWNDLVEKFKMELKRRDDEFTKEPTAKLQKLVPEEDLAFLLPFIDPNRENASAMSGANKDRKDSDGAEPNGKGNPAVPPEKVTSTPSFRKRRHTFEGEDSTDEESEESTESGSTDSESPDNKKRA